MTKKITKTFALALMVSLLATFSSFAREGMSPVIFSETGQLFKYINEDDSFATNQWKQVWDNWYYFGEDGNSKQNTWAEIEGNWYYFDQWSVMLHDTTTPDGHSVGSDGVWIPAGNETAPVQENNNE